jgi:hypothetical protein
VGRSIRRWHEATGPKAWKADDDDDDDDVNMIYYTIV